eukprot:CAMPEP_0169446174 /NCGR_PEP_ID=MMETSP1042-20121227/10833_1 /TAXON_ID=464988 /ORGANISM="Hemiselmis andersenii, Strain CCMP1180" /LENGTH=67 /DNA_ID=CAMNT_0009557621 /DNA_START=20 /DNA_END=223 /DNA_ORIENTATION=+
MFQTLFYFKVNNNFGSDKECTEADAKETGHGWTQGTCGAAGYTHMWSYNKKTGLAMFKNYKDLDAKM